MFITRFDLETTLNERDIDILASIDNDFIETQKKAISVAKSYLMHRYDADLIFINPETSFSLEDTYLIGTIFYYNNQYYVCIVQSLNHPLTDTDYFQQIDPRDPAMIDIITIITIFYLFRKVQPRNIPEWITDEYDRKIKELEAYQKGTRMIGLPVSVVDDEEQGHRITYGSQQAKTWEF